MTKPRLRFAPSPTGHLHIGGARTALYNWLMAKKTGGTFILRIENTDRERSTEEYVQSILEAMKWLGLDWDEGPFFQTQRLEIYRTHMEKLLSEGKAYRCYCTAEELEAKRKKAMIEGRKPKYDGKCRLIEPKFWNQDARPYCIRFKASQEGVTVVEDLIRGRIEFANNELDDLIIWRTDGTPTYNFSVVVDDVTMKITHVIRGDDHLNNTPRQILLYLAFDYPIPQFAHVPMILGSDKARLSKRHGATSVIAYREMGYLANALLNYLARLGWSYGDKEIFSRQELIDCFSIEAVGKSPCIFNPEKLLWLNGLYIREAQPEILLPEVLKIFERKGITSLDKKLLTEAIQSAQEKVKTLSEMADLIEFAFVDSLTYDDSAKKQLALPETKERLKKLADALETLSPFDRTAVQGAFEKLVTEMGIKLKDLAQPARAALCGKTISPGIYDVICLVGQKKSVERLRAVI